MLSSANADLAARWSRLRGEQPTLRIRDAATTLGVSEAELVALGMRASAPRRRRLPPTGGRSCRRCRRSAASCA